MKTRQANPCLVSGNSLHTNLHKAVCLYWFSPGFMSLSVLTVCSTMCTSNRFASPTGEYRLSREDGAHYQGVPHPSQPLGSVLQPVSRTHGNLHTGTPDKRRMWRVLGICPLKPIHSLGAGLWTEERKKAQSKWGESFTWETFGFWRGITVQSHSYLQINGNARCEIKPRRHAHTGWVALFTNGSAATAPASESLNSAHARTQNVSEQGGSSSLLVSRWALEDLVWTQRLFNMLLSTQTKPPLTLTHFTAISLQTVWH